VGRPPGGVNPEVESLFIVVFFAGRKEWIAVNVAGRGKVRWAFGVCVVSGWSPRRVEGYGRGKWMMRIVTEVAYGDS
jgi:hypothetical protein